MFNKIYVRGYYGLVVIPLYTELQMMTNSIIGQRMQGKSLVK
jgi:hypothetical protein